MASDKFIRQRKLHHQLCDLWRECFGKEWVERMRGDTFYFPVAPADEVALRTDLIAREVNELDAMILSTRLNMEVIEQ